MKALLLFLALAGSAPAWAEPGCTRTCQDKSRQCRERCVKESASSEAQMTCRSDCLADSDACRCDCGERAYCAGGSSNRGCHVLVAERAQRVE